MRNLTDDEASDAQVKTGVLVTDVKEGSPADNAGIQANDIIEEVGGKTVSDVAEFGRLLRLARTNKKPAILLVNRNGNTTFYSLRLTS